MMRSDFSRAAARKRIAAPFWAAVLWVATGATVAQAQILDDYTIQQRDFRSPETFVWEARVGPYVPEVGGNAFRRSYPGDHGLLLGMELDFVALRVPDVLYLCPAAGFGWAKYSGKALSIETGEPTDEDTSFEMFPLSLLGAVRIDVLSRKLGAPLILTGKLGYRWTIWDADKGGSDDGNGVSPAWTWAVQGALELDFFDSRSARILDEDWGINHSFLFFELFGSKTVGDGTRLDDTAWTVGIGFVI